MSRDRAGRRDLQALIHYHRALRHLEAAAESWGQDRLELVRGHLDRARAELDLAYQLLPRD